MLTRSSKFIYLFIALFSGTYISSISFQYTGERLTQNIREEYLGSVLRQNQGFFDNIGTGEITVKITSDTNQIQSALSE